MVRTNKVRRAFRVLWLIGACVFGGGCQTAQSATAAAPDRATLARLVAQTITTSDETARTATALAAAEEATGPLVTALASIERATTICEINLANAETTAYKATRTGRDPAGKLFSRFDMSQGSLQNTGRPLDLAISGSGFFKVKVADSSGDGFAYTRNGNFFVNKEGALVLGVGDGPRLQPAINVPKNVTEITVSADGRIEAVVAGLSPGVSVGRIELCTFMNAEDLALTDAGLFVQTEGSGVSTKAMPGESGAGHVLQGFLEASNVDPTHERIRIKFLQGWRETILKVVDARR